MAADPRSSERSSSLPAPAGPPLPAPPLTATGRVILGMIAKGVRSGYEIKQLVDKSTRHFWAASYGQIYPELRRLEDDGLIEGRADPSGARVRMVYELTPRGEQALEDWLFSERALVYELRDEGMLKLFFSDLEPESALRTVRAMREQHEKKHEQLGLIQAAGGHISTGPGLALEIGLGVTGWLIEWCKATEARLAGDLEETV
ncbi:MAG TPA: PadR family transcriptional regulator [Solirubrobacteraceae bacterium]|nr:PadR family transcriptional regulator [Solirubrobacteraceae bacterium]